MAKPALGRGLGNLMREGQVSLPSPETADQEPANLSPGMASLLRGANGHPRSEMEAKSSTTASTATQASRLRTKLVRTSLVVADVLLVTLAVWLVSSASGPLGFLGVVLTVAAITLGAWLTCLALHL